MPVVIKLFFFILLNISTFITLFEMIKHMGLIQIEGMEFYSFHGHYLEEQIVGSRFIVDLTIETDMSRAALTDNLDDAVNYQRAYEIVRAQMEKKSYLLENIAGRILDALFGELNGIVSATVKVSKLNPPVGGKTAAVSVIMSRTNNSQDITKR